MIEQPLILITLLIQLGVAAAVSSVLARSRRFRVLLFHEDRDIWEKIEMVLFVGGRSKRFYVMPDVGSADYGALLQEMEEKHIKHVMASLPPGQPGAAANGALACNVPPGTIITEDDILELQANSGG